MPDAVTTAHEKAVRALKWHAAIFAIVNLVLIVVNLVKTPQYFWAKWVLLDWGVGLATHAWIVFRSNGRNRVDRA